MNVKTLKYFLSFQLQKATIEVNQTKEDMKSVQNDLANADKEITVRQFKQMYFDF